MSNAAVESKTETFVHESPELGRSPASDDIACSLCIHESQVASPLPDGVLEVCSLDLRSSTVDRVEDWPSMLVIFYCILVSEAARGLLLPSMWPHLKALGGRRRTLGLVVASFSFGNMLATIPLGVLADKTSIGWVLIGASLLQLGGHALYTVAAGPASIISTRFLAGLGSATIPICRAHVTRATSDKQRTCFMAYLSAFQFGGFAILPAFAGLLAMLPVRELPRGLVLLDAATYPAIVLVVANGVAIGLVVAYYHEPANEGVSQSTSALYCAVEPALIDSPPNWIAILSCLGLNIFFRGVSSELEVVAIPVLMQEFALSLSEAGALVGLMGIPGLLVCSGFRALVVRFSDRALIVAALVSTAVGSLIIGQPIGMPPLPVFVVAVGLTWSIGYPVGQTAALGLFSKCLVGLPTGGLLGVFSGAGSVARILFALLAALLWSTGGILAVFFQIELCTLGTILIVWKYYRHLKARPAAV